MDRVTDDRDAPGPIWMWPAAGLLAILGGLLVLVVAVPMALYGIARRAVGR